MGFAHRTHENGNLSLPCCHFHGAVSSTPLPLLKLVAIPLRSAKLASLGRGAGIRTQGLLVPNQARYQLRYTPNNEASKELLQVTFRRTLGQGDNLIFKGKHLIMLSRRNVIISKNMQDPMQK